MTSYAVDMLSTTIQPAAIRTAGFLGVCRYLRNLTMSEARGYLQAGLGVATIFETQAAESLGGGAAGIADGRTAAGQCVALGQPSGSLLWVNLADFAPPPADIPQITAYWRAFRTVTAGLQVGGYATGYVIDQLVKAGETGPWWQNAMNDSGWPGTTLHPQTSLYQDTIITLPAIAGTRPGDYDQNVIIGSSLNWWTAKQPGPVPPPAPNPSAPLGGIGMFLFEYAGGTYLSAGGMWYRWVVDQWDLNAVQIANPGIKNLGPVNGVKGMGIPADQTTAKLSGQPWPVTGPPA